MEIEGAIVFSEGGRGDRSSPIHLTSNASDATHYDRRSKSLEKKFMVCDKHTFVYATKITSFATEC